MVRERQLGELLPTLRDIQWAFNDDPEHGYDFIFLSEVPFSDWFQKLIQDFLSKRPSKPNVSFGVIPKEHWDVPPQINLEKARKGWEYRLSKSIPYAHSQTYRQMCRYMSAPIYQHSLLKDLDYIWRLEPQTQHLCTLQSHWKEVNGKREWIERDPFRYMRDNHKKYAWANIMTEYKATVMSLMAKAHWWRRDYPQYIAANNSWSFVTDDGKGYNLCHYWTNFEIVDLSFVRSPAYTTFFEVLDKSGGFFLERWGDAPVRTLAASMMLDRSEVWHMDYIGYFHPPVTICPLQKDPGQSCVCDPHLNLDYSPGLAKCQARSDELYGIDSIAVIQSINKDRGVIENFKEGEMAYAIPPPRLATQPII